MTDHMTIDHEVGKRITAADECALVQAAYARNPASTLLRDRLAVLFNRNDRFAEAIALYAGVDPYTLGFAEVLVLVHAHMALEQPTDTARAADLATVAFEVADEDFQRAAALAARGKAQRRMGATDAAEHSLRQALIHDPHNKDACKRLASLHFDAGAPQRVLDDMAQLDAQGVGHSRHRRWRWRSSARSMPRARRMGGTGSPIAARSPRPPGSTRSMRSMPRLPLNC
ncbi:tetratricopeptide repeat protein [Sphingomonas sp.]|uniref:tetratricopeptide repeat protein n=1 Tax=Sphingomonas sp. TaxID=28214 RepID=UPI003F7238B9